MPSPIKKRFPADVEIENRVQAGIEPALGVDPGPKPPAVHAADELSLFQEIRDLMPQSSSLPQPMPGQIDHLPPIEVMSADQAKDAFMEEAARLLHGQLQTVGVHKLRL